jgi:rsbT antagonist protein RsbS
MNHIPIISMGEVLLVTVQADMHDRLATVLKEDLATCIFASRARGVIIDISSLDMVDSFLARVFGEISQMAKVMDAEALLVGMQPFVAITLVEMGVTMDEVHTAANVERGLALLRASLDQEVTDAPALRQ